MSTEVADEQAIRTLMADWLAATKAGDRDRVLAMMTDDVVFHVAGQPPLGKSEFAAHFAAMAGNMGSAVFEARNNVHELRVNGDWAYARCFFEIKVTPRGGATRQRSGFTLTIFHKQPSGRWLLARDANVMA